MIVYRIMRLFLFPMMLWLEIQKMLRKMMGKRLMKVNNAVNFFIDREVLLFLANFAKKWGNSKFRLFNEMMSLFEVARLRQQFSLNLVFEVNWVGFAFFTVNAVLKCSEPFKFFYKGGEGRIFSFFRNVNCDRKA